MARSIYRLTPKQVQHAKAGTNGSRGMHADGGGLWLQVTRAKNDPKELHRSWLYRYASQGKTREMGLGSLSTVSLVEARDAALHCRKLRAQGIDPLEYRRAARADAAAKAARIMTFDECAKEYIRTHSAGWKNAKHIAQWPSSLKKYVSPIFGRLPVQLVDQALVMKAIEPIWQTKTETARRVRGRIESILNWAAVRKLRAGENPARWRGHLSELLAPAHKVTPVVHHAALPYAEIPGFMVALREREGIAACALEFLILTAARTSEVTGSEWPEFDLNKFLWTIPAARMKAGVEHRVPLSDRAITILKARLHDHPGKYVFRGGRGGPLSNMAMAETLKGMERGDVTVHGFRSTFRDWASERANFPNEICEMALAHRISDETEAAYRRGDLLEKRRKLMAAWAKFCARPVLSGDNVVELKAVG
jgi:integrase